jgi:hypothetical protein
LRTCPRCGNHVEVYRTSCDCGYSWLPRVSNASESHDGAVSVTTEEVRDHQPRAAFEQSTRRSAWPWIAGACLIAVLGWHVVCAARLGSSMEHNLRLHFSEVPSIAVSVEVKPHSNLVSIGIHARGDEARSMREFERRMADADFARFRQEIEPAVERELSLAARSQFDLYAMLLPYRASFSLDFPPQAK